MPTPSIWVRYCGNGLRRASNLRQLYLSPQEAISALAFWRGTPCDQSPTVSRSGHRVDARRRFRSSSAACGTCTLKGVTSLLAAGSEMREAFCELSWALIGLGPADNKPALAVMAVCMNRRRFSELCM